MTDLNITVSDIRIQRGAGAPASLERGEPDLDETDDILRVGKASGMAVFRSQGYVDTAVANVNSRSLANTGATTIHAGKAVMMNLGSTGVLPWDGTREIVGLARENIAASESGRVQTEGPLTLADWTASTGSSSLGTGTWYGDPSTPGTLTLTAPTSIGATVQRVGITVSADTLEIRVGQPIKL